MSKCPLRIMNMIIRLIDMIMMKNASESIFSGAVFN